MRKLWIGAALAAMYLAQSASAQYPLPALTPLAPPTPLPEPVPVGSSGHQENDGKQFIPGPLSGAYTPPGPEDKLSLPYDIPSAWGKGPTPESGAYLHLGAMALWRLRPGSGVVALDDGVTVLDKRDIDPELQFGARATIGYLFDDAAIELTGFYLPEQRDTVAVTAPGQLALPFVNPPAAFLGPNGTNLFTAADRASLRFQTALGDGELNYRWWSRAFYGVEGIIGFRYFDLQEEATISVDNSVTGGSRNFPAGGLDATYLSSVHNHMLMPQVGFEWNYPIAYWLYAGLMGKAAVGVDDIDLTTRLSNGLGAVGVQTKTNEWTWTSLFELDAFFDVVTLEKVRIRLGYMAVWAVHVAEGLQQINSNLAVQPGIRDSGNIFYHGPLLEVQFLF
jgi:hypothetical protein